MSDRERSRSPMDRKPIIDRERSPQRRDDSPRNHRDKSYSRSPSFERKQYREDRRRRDDRRDRRRYAGTRDNPKPSRCLGIFGLSQFTNEDELHHIMSKYGSIERVQLVIDVKSGRSRGFSFIYFDNIEDAKLAKEECTGMKIDGKAIRVDYSITERAHTPTPGVYMGKPTYKYNDKYDRRRERDYGGRSRYRRSPSIYYRRKRYGRSRSRSYSSRRY